MRSRPATIDIVGFHGQTVLHRPKQKLTIQIGDGQALADRLGIDVAYDFRAADIAAGGEGAPIVPVFHRALVMAGGMKGEVALLNIGGVANVTYVVDGEQPIACDTGPGNALIDDLMLQRTGAPIDRHGHMAARGRVNEAALLRMLAHPFFDLPPPKSLDRNAFSLDPVSQLVDRGRRRDAHRLHGRLGAAAVSASADAAATAHRLRRRRAQSDPRARTGHAPAVQGDHRRRRRLVGGFDGGAGLRLSRRAGAGRAAR